MNPQGDLKRYLTAIRRRWWLPVLLAAIAVAGVYYRLGDLPPRYAAATTLIVTSPPVSAPAPGAPGAPPPFPSSPATVISDIVELIQTRTVAERVVGRIDGADLAQLRRDVSAVWRRGTNLLRIEATGIDPQRAALIANTYAEELMNYFRQTNAHDAREAREFIEGQLADVRSRLDASDRAVLAARNVTNVEGAAASIVGRYYATLEELQGARRQLRETDARLAAMTARLSREERTIVAQTDRVENPAFAQIRSQLIALEVERTQLSAIYTPAHPRMQRLEGQIAALQGRLAKESETLVGREVHQVNPIRSQLMLDAANFQVERAANMAGIAALEQAVAAARGEANAFPRLQFELDRLGRENEILETLYRTLSQQFQDALLRENVAAFFPAGIQVVETAVAPARPQTSSFPRTGATAAGAGFVLGLLAAVFLESLDEGVRTSEDVERALGAPVLAEVPDVALSRRVPATAVITIALVLIAGLLAGMMWMIARTPGDLSDAMARLGVVWNSVR